MILQRIVDRLAKWKLHRFYSNHKDISRYLPPAALLTQASLENYTNTYGTVYIKGNTMHMGTGIVKAWKARGGYDFIRVRGKVQHASSAAHLIGRIKQMAPKELFIVQKGINLATINRHPYDIRVMMMRDGSRKWNYAGMVAKVHGPGSIVSNVRRGRGYVLPVEEALAKSNFNGAQIRRIKSELIALSKKIIKYSEKYPFYSYQSGIDLAVDKSGKLWIIEVNLHNPSHGLFRKLKDLRQYYRVRRLYKDYLQHNTRLI